MTCGKGCVKNILKLDVTIAALAACRIEVSQHAGVAASHTELVNRRCNFKVARK